MKTITAAEANRRFSSLLREVSRGTSITVTSRGRPVATISAVAQGAGQRVAARSNLLARLRSQKVTGARNWSRDDLYE